MTFDDEELDKLTHLSRIECTEEEKKKLKKNLSRVLSYVEQLKEVNTDGISPCNHVLETMSNIWRDDEVGELLPRDLFLSNAPAHVGGMIRVPPVIQF
jgi:aspartyl-tRNA(Asn)/glutamyl-tRNA(Gln) amidotransferase subunit C